MLRRRLTTSLLALAASLSLFAPPTAAAQGGGTVTGTVTDGGTGQPIQQARVLVAGTQIGTLTGENGRYTLRVPNTGSVTLEVSRIGFEAQRVTVNVTEGAPVVADVKLGQAAFSLAAVVTTVTGQQRKVELANATTQVNVAEKIAELPVSNMGALLSGRSSGVQVVQTGATGTGSRVRIRGQNSFSLSNDPIIVIDGVRASGATGDGLGVGGSGPSRLDDINPNEIESLEIIKGPSAATLYGTEAANGVIVITTKRGKSGRTTWNLSAENGRINNTAEYPDLWSLWGRRATAPNVSAICTLQEMVDGRCVAGVTDSLSRGNVLNQSDLTPIGTGNRQQYNLQSSGGNDKVQFFVSGQTESETGIYKMPSSEVTRLETQRGVTSLPSDIMRPNALARNSFRANVSAELRPNLFLQVSSGFINSDLRLPQNEDNGNGLMVAALGGNWRGDLKDSQGNNLRGYRSFMMGDVLAQTTSQNINRFINTATAQWNPVSWLATRAALGSDITFRNDLFISKVGEGPNTGTVRSGNITANRVETNQQTADYGATGTFQLLDWLNSKTSVGMQYVRNFRTLQQSTGIGLPPGGVTVTAAATRSSTQNITDRRTLGYYVEQQFGIRDKLFLTGGLRRDAASAFGANTRAVYYPKVGASWLISDEAFFPKGDWLNSLRLRGTYGASGQIPADTASIKAYSPGALTLASGETPGATLSSLGNANLKPEYSAETEFGFDLQMFSGRTNIELTSYNKSTTDALILRDIAPSLSGLQSQIVNIGNIKNSGVELTWNQRIIESDAVGLSFALTGSTLKNRMTKLAEGVATIPSGNRNTQQNRPGYPIYGLWDRTVTPRDVNNDGIIAGRSEVVYSDTAIYQGSSFPTKEMAFTPTLELLNKKLRITSQFDGKWGITKFNNTLRHQCQNGVTCRGRYDKSVSLQEQAYAYATADAIYTGQMENGDFIRWRELSVSYEMPTAWANKLRTTRWNIVLTGRNLGVMTDYKGVDPEASAANSDQRGGEEYFSTPPLRILMLRMNFSF
ncbi:putative outer membrane protein [Gemmatimonas aurantiaca T-27]|uniref:Putative outer membrane protein n=1 Tax=Gemmatimonas aurantiaca (strain DSM 14586 / JCM 11422 / NBRC 100505 / T-27) TaxID=379066 RepID=C1AAV4_GEMAT|nr:putative outer membrane protein [Gemmatimonas aurantiaca T-27]